MSENLIAFSIVAAALVASPGPDSILILKNTLGGGRVPGWLTVAGVQLGVATHALLSAAGLSALLYYSPAAFRALALAGALYLAHLGWMTIKSGITPAQARGGRIAPARAFSQGVFCNLLNPKVIILFVALMPGFVDTTAGGKPRQILILAAILLAINIPFQLMLVLIAAKVNTLLGDPAASRALRWLLGGTLLFFATALFTDHVLSYAT